VSGEQPRSRRSRRSMKDFVAALLPGRAPEQKTPAATKRINLALQGGGAHGAFTWGVLDHLLDDERLSVEGISGTSAGAVNAVMLADGLARGGRAEAKKRLADFWRAVSSNGQLPTLQRTVMERLLSFTPLEGTPVAAWFDALSYYFSPYDVNPLNINPLKDLIERFVDFDALRACSDLQIFISATNVQTGRVRIFPRDKITADAVMASACLPLLFRAVKIDGVPYWDGGYLGNPVIFPFFRTTSTEDVLVVQINPLVRHDTPMSSSEIMNRINEITFNSSLIGEYRAIDFVARLIDQGRLPRGLGPGQYRRINVHRIVLDRSGSNFDASSKLSTDYDFFEMLRVSGRRAARRFLDQHFDDIGMTSTVDLAAEAQAEWA
jgi:NTE family protein